MQLEFCPYDGTDLGSMSIATDPDERKFLVCPVCEAQGPKKESVSQAVAAFKQRDGRTVLEITNDRFVVAWGYDKFLLTFDQMSQWHEVESDDALERLNEKRRLLMEWQLIPQTKFRE